MHKTMAMAQSVFACAVVSLLDLLMCIAASSATGVNAKGAAEAVNAIVENTTQCKFEATSPASDEVVLFNILQVQYLSSCAA